jgi:hypothetical protein
MNAHFYNHFKLSILLPIFLETAESCMARGATSFAYRHRTHDTDNQDIQNDPPLCISITIHELGLQHWGPPVGIL